MIRALAALSFLVAAAGLAPPAAAVVPVGPAVCAINLVASGQAVADPASLLDCGFTGSQGFVALYSSGTQGGTIADPVTMLVGALPTWSCSSGGAPVLPGDSLPDSDPEVTCQPPAGALPLDCQTVEARVLPLGAGPGSVSGTAACGALAATATPLSPYASAGGSGPFPLSCSAANAAAPGEAWLLFCAVNL